MPGHAETPSRSPNPSRTAAYDLVFALAVLVMGAAGAMAACSMDAPASVGNAADATTPVDGEELAAAAGATVVAAKTEAPATNPVVGITTGAAPEPFDAVVGERIRAGGYAYLKVTAATGKEHWLATMGEGQAPGTSVTVHTYGTRENFVSRRTGRTFDRLLFGEAKPAA